MKYKFFLFFFLCTSLFAFDESPWLPPFLEFQAEVGHHYMHTKRVETPLGSFSYCNDYHNPFLSAGVTFWPDLFAEAALGFLQTDRTSFSYQSFALRLRRQWLDDLCGDPFSLTTTLMTTFPPTRILHDFGYPFHGYCNGELDLSIGKEFRDSLMNWIWRSWALLGYGVAERGSPWVRGSLTFAYALSCSSSLHLFSELLYGLGTRAIDPSFSFPGYHSIAHQTIDLGAKLQFDIGLYTTLSCLVFVNLYAHNFIQHTYGGTVQLTIPFGF